MPFIRGGDTSTWDFKMHIIVTKLLEMVLRNSATSFLRVWFTCHILRASFRNGQLPYPPPPHLQSHLPEDRAVGTALPSPAHCCSLPTHPQMHPSSISADPEANPFPTGPKILLRCPLETLLYSSAKDPLFSMTLDFHHGFSLSNLAAMVPRRSILHASIIH